MIVGSGVSGSGQLTTLLQVIFIIAFIRTISFKRWTS